MSKIETRHIGTIWRSRCRSVETAFQSLIHCRFDKLLRELA